MTRVLSGAVLLLVAIAIVWFAPGGSCSLAVAELMLSSWVLEFAGLARDGSGLRVAVVRVVARGGVVAARRSQAVIRLRSPGSFDAVAVDGAWVADWRSALASWRGSRTTRSPPCPRSMFPCIYIGLPIGAMVVVRGTDPRRVAGSTLFLLMLTVVVSDSAQYYSGRTFGRTPLAPSVSPKKTIEGAVGGFIFGAACLAVVGAWWLPGVPTVVRALLGIVIVTMGIVGDLFESMLKRSAGVKDSSTLIPGHGGILDRIDALLFAIPPFYYIAVEIPVSAVNHGAHRGHRRVNRASVVKRFCLS